MTRRTKHQGPSFKGFDSHVHVTVSEAQRLKVQRLAKRAGLSLSKYMRSVIDDLESTR